MQFGWSGKILRIDLTDGKIRLDSTMKYAREFIGGRGIAAKILYEECPPKVKPLDPESLLIFSTGPLSGTTIPGGGRVGIACKSPLTVPEGLMCETGFGGFWGTELKLAGYDHLIISGHASHPVYIGIYNSEVKIIDANKFWGKDAYESARLIKEDFDIDSRVITIGQAGENLVRFASILGGEQYSASGRGGSGAVMGSKNLKGIAVRGTGEVKIANPKKLLEITEKWHELIKNMPNYAMLKKQGEFRIHLIDNLDYCTVGNYETAEYPPLRNIKPDEFVETYQVKMIGCSFCPRPCFNFMKVKGSPLGGLTCSSLVAMESLVWNDDLHTLWEAATLCNTYCMDVIETAGCIAFLMELYQRGIIIAEDTNHILFEKGSKRAIIDAVHRIAKRESYGDILANGIPRASQRIGRNAEEFAIHTKGLFPFFYIFQAFKGHSLIQAIGGRSIFPIAPSLRFELKYDDPLINQIARKIGKERYGDEEALEPSKYSEAKVSAAIDSEHSKLGPDLLGTCTRHVPRIIPEIIALEAFNAVTGVELTVKELVRVEEKLVHLERAFDVREGIRRQNDTLPRRFFTQEVDSGKYKGAVIEEEKFERMKDLYYQKRGWDVETGIPRREILERVGLAGIADDLDNLGICKNNI
jgi:aldehyde:ferredoxin oxidoreductase